MQTSGKLRGSTRQRLIASVAGCGVLWLATLASGADRTTFLLPMDARDAGKPPPSGMYADAAFGEASKGWQAYIKLWKSHHQDPADPRIRRFLGLPSQRAFQMDAQRGRSAPRWLGWRSGTFAKVETPHFLIYSRAAEEPSRRVAEDLERCYWIWTQMFFPLWEGAAQVSSAIGSIGEEQSVHDFLVENDSRLTVGRQLQVVLFRDADEYRATLGREIPGIERSSGYYDERKQTTFLYADESDDPATRRHEMVHQLLRQATRSGLGRLAPGEKNGFWLVEGIAGYFESLYIDGAVATVGGWDSPRLQFARYRVLVGGDSMPIAELIQDGRVAAQRRSDLARWYAHAIAQTHQLIDGGKPNYRRWVYRQLANLYKIRAQLASPVDSASLTRSSLEAGIADEIEGGTPVVELERSLRAFLSLNDQDLVTNPSRQGLRELCLAGCEVSEQGLLSIAPSSQLRWLDLSRLPIGNQAVRRICPQPESLQQLTLEVTRIDGGLLEWLGRADNLSEVDLSWTPLDDSAIQALAVAPGLSILWMTGTKVSDRSIDPLIAMSELQSVDVQRTGVTDAGIDRLRAARPNLQINPLELRSP